MRLQGAKRDKTGTHQHIFRAPVEEVEVVVIHEVRGIQDLLRRVRDLAVGQPTVRAVRLVEMVAAGICARDKCQGLAATRMPARA